MPLTDVQIRKAASKDKQYKLYDALGLFVLVKPSGSKLWRQKYIVAGKERLLAHGSYPGVSLKEAREKRDAIRNQLAVGQDPAVEKRLAEVEARTKARTTFPLVAEEYI